MCSFSFSLYRSVPKGPGDFFALAQQYGGWGFVAVPNHCALKAGARQTKIRHIQYVRTVLNFEA